MTKDSQYLARLRSYYAENGGLPSYSTIGRLVGFSSKASVAQMIGRLADAGFVEMTPERRLRPGQRFFERSVADRVRAGAPTGVSDGAIDAINIDGYLVRDHENTTLVRVAGDSMRDAGIHEGDVLVVECRTDAMEGQIVVAQVDGEFTVKRLAREHGRFVLQAEHSGYPTLRPRDGFEIIGVVVGLVRKYGQR